MSPTVTLRFRNDDERDFFMGQLSDGWGENEVVLTFHPLMSWDEALKAGGPFDVDPTGTELWAHHIRVKQWLKDHATTTPVAEPEETK